MEQSQLSLDLGRKLAADISAACKRTTSLASEPVDCFHILTMGCSEALGWLVGCLDVNTFDLATGKPDTLSVDERAFLAAAILARGVTEKEPAKAFEMGVADYSRSRGFRVKELKIAAKGISPPDWWQKIAAQERAKSA